MSERTLIASATNLLVRGFEVVPTDRLSRAGAPVNGLFAVARAIQRVVELKRPARAVAVVDAGPPKGSWPELLKSQVAMLPVLLRTLGLQVVETTEELNLVASYAKAARDSGDDVIIAGVDKRYAQLVSERVWWFDANKNVRYTEDIVQSRFEVPAPLVGHWLALVGYEDELPGVKGIGAKGAAELLTKYGAIEQLIAAIDTMEGRLGKALKAAKTELPEKLAQARLDTSRPLPLPLSQLASSEPNAPALNALFEQLGFDELLVAESTAQPVTVCSSEADVTAELAKAGAAFVAMAPLIEDDGSLVGLGLASAQADSFYVPATSAGFNALTRWLQSAEPKGGHDLVAASVSLEKLGIHLNGIVHDSACESHLTQPSNWAPHDLPLVAKLALGRALPDDDEVLGTGKSRKSWAALPVERAADIAGQRASASRAICEKLSVSPALLTEYLELSRTLVRMELHGIAVDRGELERAETSFAEIERALETEIEKHAGHSFNINSSKQLGEVLFDELKLPSVHHTKTGRSTSNEALERIEHAHPIVSLVMRWRTLRRLRDSWLIALRDCIEPDGRVHSRFHPARSFSGHLINTNPDLGRVPGRTTEMSRVRRAFVSSPGTVFMSVDFSQLGLYVLAHWSKDPALTGPLSRRADMHRLTAAAVLEKSPDAVTLDERQLGKVINFATFAGQGASALAMQLGVPAAEAKLYLERFDHHYAKVRAFQDEQFRLAKERGFITTIAGRTWPIGGLESLDSQLRSYAERLARRATHEGSVADVGRRALLDADKALRAAGLATVPILQILDEVLFEVPETELQSAARLCAEAMRNCFQLEVPLVVGVWVGKNWADLEEMPLPT